MKLKEFSDGGALAIRTDHTPRLRVTYLRLIKRPLDILASLVLLPVILPILAIIWCVSLFDGGHAFFGQDRIGRGGKTYRCYKARTMVRNAEAKLVELCKNDPERAAEWATYQKLENDPRITRFGRILRATSLDELPQIFNVLKGDMSLVGPRPFMVSQAILYKEAGGMAYFDLRPGITGLWQVAGRSGTTFAQRVEYDDAYHAAASLTLDLRLVWQTAAVVLYRTGR